jgi:hypothetical protein
MDMFSSRLLRGRSARAPALSCCPQVLGTALVEVQSAQSTAIAQVSPDGGGGGDEVHRSPGPLQAQTPAAAAAKAARIPPAMPSPRSYLPPFYSAAVQRAAERARAGARAQTQAESMQWNVARVWHVTSPPLSPRPPPGHRSVACGRCVDGGPYDDHSVPIGHTVQLDPRGRGDGGTSTARTLISRRNPLSRGHHSWSPISRTHFTA